MDRDARVRWPLLLAVGAVPVLLVLFGGHRGTHAARNLLVPGAGLLETLPLGAVACFVSVVAAVVAWLRWGTDWIVVAVLVATMAASAMWGTGGHGDDGDLAARSAHEFPIVVLIIAFLAWIRSAIGGVPGFGRVRGRRARQDTSLSLLDLPPVDRCRAVTILSLADEGGTELSRAVGAADVDRRARRISRAARLRFGDPLARDHVHVRTARTMVGGPAGGDDVPTSEPGFVRLLDAILAAVALDGDASDVLAGPFAARRGHRPAWWWTPLGMPGGRALDWEHATATALAHERGWIDDGDWALLRRRVLGAAARGVSRRDDERLIAAGRLWLALVDDDAARAVVDRPTVRHDALARAIDSLARHLRDRPLDREGGVTGTINRPDDASIGPMAGPRTSSGDPDGGPPREVLVTPRAVVRPHHPPAPSQPRPPRSSTGGIRP
ncbi:hypothetical protein [Ilumatobacter sp.]|uniref:hypothetical protein n=1 Tax=Ilumatobacter sp. TaxID=1967498 RepID=UPI003B52C74E